MNELRIYNSISELNERCFCLNGMNYPSSNWGYEMYDSLTITSTAHHRNSFDTTKSSIYLMCCFIRGEGCVRYPDAEMKISEGDVLFIPPARSVSVIGDDVETVSVGVKGREIKLHAEQLDFSAVPRIFSNLGSLVPLWRSLCGGVDFAVTSVRAKGVLFYTLSELYTSAYEGSKMSISSAANRTKSFIDTNLTNPDISLKMIGEALSYHPNYLSKVFKSEFGINVARYINIERIRYACLLIEGGESSVKNIAFLCGFSDEEYFSSVFKAHVGETPREHVKRTRNFGSTL